VQQLDFPKAVGDCIAARASCAQPGIEAAPAVVGFCLGGTLAWSVAINAEPSCCVAAQARASRDDGHDRSGEVPDVVPLRQRRPYIPNERRRPRCCSPRRPPRVRAERGERRPFDNHDSDMFYNEAAANSAWTKTMAFLASHTPA
jgi:carboxymethylenebutenolidase